MVKAPQQNGYGSEPDDELDSGCGILSYDVETRAVSCLTLVLAAQPIPTDTITSQRYSNLVDPARGHCYRGPTKPCESNAARHGGLLSNTWITYPWVGYKPGKLGIIPDRSGMLECV